MVKKSKEQDRWYNMELVSRNGHGCSGGNMAGNLGDSKTI